VPPTNWDRFVMGAPWIVRSGEPATVGEPRPANPALIDGERFPVMRTLISSAIVTPVAIGEDDYELLTWATASGDPLSWLCLPTPAEIPPVHPDHRSLLAGFGGIVERSQPEPTTWLLNCNDTLTAREARHDASYLSDYAWILKGLCETWPIAPDEYYSICREANGNDTLCHRTKGDVLMFAPDHAFTHLDILDGCPPYSLYRIQGVQTFTDWVESVAQQWVEIVNS
jgi:hypothetical protein